MRLTVREIGVHEKNRKAWAQLPSRPWVKDGHVVTSDDGKAKYSPLFEFDDDRVRFALSDMVIRAVAAHEAGLTADFAGCVR